METERPRRRFTAPDVLRVVVVLACWGAGLVLRLQPRQQDEILGGGLIILGCVLLIYWAQRSKRRR